MSLVTRCTACGTLFKVVADQLKISDGWVRCGQCAHVFDAQSNLVDAGAVPPTLLATKFVAINPNSMPAEGVKSFENSVSSDDIAALQEWAPGVNVDVSHSAYSEKVIQTPPTEPVNLDEKLRETETDGSSNLFSGFVNTPNRHASDQLVGGPTYFAQDSRAFKPGLLRDSDELDSEVGPSTTSWAPSDYVAQHADALGTPAVQHREHSAQLNTRDGTSQNSPLLISRPVDLRAIEMTESGVSQASTQPQPTPSFVKQAQHAARWRSPWVRASLGILALLLLGLLTVQVTLQEKDRVAAAYPESKPWLDQLCVHASCRVEPFKRIESIVIDSSSFNRINKNNAQLEAVTQSYKLAVTFKNTGNLAVAVPHVELSLQDAQDQSIMRRVLSPADLGAKLDRIQPAQEMVGHLTLQISTSQLAGSRINGYRVLAFYP